MKSGRHNQARFCPQCGQANGNQSTFCMACGARLGNVARSGANTRATNSRRRSRALIVGLLAIVAVVIVAAAAIAVLLVGRGGNDTGGGGGNGGGNPTEQYAPITENASRLVLRASDIEDGCTQSHVYGGTQGASVLSSYDVAFYCSDSGQWWTDAYDFRRSRVTVYSSVDAARNAYASREPKEYGSSSAVQHYHTDIGDECYVMVIESMNQAEVVFRVKNVLADVGTPYSEDAEYYARIMEQRIG